MNTTPRPRLLIVEDEPVILAELVDVFVYHGFDVETAVDGEAGLSRGLSGKYDLILLDVMLPKRDGFSVCNEIRKNDLEQPIIMLTAKNSDEDIIHGLSLGADDYVSKPFSVQELVLRANAVLRRSRKLKRAGAVLSLGGDIEIDTLTLKGRGRGKEALVFTRREVEILQYLSEHRDRPVPRGELLQEVWGYRRSADLDTRTVDIHIAKLRRKIEADSDNPKLLMTIRGEGYQLNI